MELSEIRPQIDAINKQMLELFEKRMALCREVALYKEANGMEVFVPAREAAILDWVDSAASSELQPYAKAFFNAVLQLSRDYQNASLGRPAEETALVSGGDVLTAASVKADYAEMTARIDILLDRIDALLARENTQSE